MIALLIFILAILFFLAGISPLLVTEDTQDIVSLGNRNVLAPACHRNP